MARQGRVVIISGPVGSGKTTLSKALAEISEAPLAMIEGDKFWKFFMKTTPAQNRVACFKTSMSSMLAASLPFARSGFEVLVDFSIPPWFLDAAKRVVINRGFTLDYVAIVPSLDVCAERAANRAEGAFEDYSVVKELFDEFDKLTGCIRDDSSDPATLARQIRAGLDSGRFLVPA